MDGLLLIDKPGDCTSHDIVQRARRLLGQKKIGHCGTLDPTATGLLLLTLGKATRLTRFLIRAPKVYTGSIRFGQVTDTYDAAGEVTEERELGALTIELVSDAMRGFLGEYEHLTPAYSAKKSGGRKRYELARRGDEVPEERKLVRIYDFEATSELKNGNEIDFRLACSSGTYARSLAHELGGALGCGAHLSSLRRIEIGPFDVNSAITLETLEQIVTDSERESDAKGSSLRDQLQGALTSDNGWIGFDDIQLPFVTADLDGSQERRLRHGQTVLLPALEGAPGDWVRMANRRGKFIAVGTVAEVIGERNLAVVQPRIVFASGVPD